MNRPCVSLIVVFFLSGSLILGASTAAADEAADAQGVVNEAKRVFEEFVADADMTWFRNNMHRARGLLIVPTYGKAGFIIGGAGGSGLLIGRKGSKGWSHPAFYTMGEASIGLQIGVQSSELIFIIMSDKGMRKMVDGKAQLGGDMSVAAGPVGAGASAATADVIAFARSKGAYAGVSVEGAVIQTYDDRNAAYYGKSVSAADIVLEDAVSNPGANALLKAVSAKLGG